MCLKVQLVNLQAGLEKFNTYIIHDAYKTTRLVKC